MNMDAVGKLKNLLYLLLNENKRKNKAGIICEYIISVIICLNVVLIVFESMGFNGRIAPILKTLRMMFFVFFLTEYIIRIWISDIVTTGTGHPIKSRLKYIFSFRAMIDLLALMPVILGKTIVDFRIFRILRLLRITQLKMLKQYTDILIRVIKLKGAQLVASLFIVMIFVLLSAVVVYDLENPVQPEVFDNILTGLWWSVSAITTVGYGDIYPITPLGRILAAFMSIFGVFLMAVPIGILTTGFFEASRKSEHESKKHSHH